MKLLILLILIACDDNQADKHKTLDELFQDLEAKEVRETIVLKNSGTYDFKKVVHIWKGKGVCNQQENQPQILRIEGSDITVKNFYFKGNSGDPVHIATCGKGQGNLCSGSNKNIVIDNMIGHACEDLLTIGTPNSRNITIQNSTFFPNPNKEFKDKTIQINFGHDIKILNNTFIDGERCVRIKPSTSVTIKGNKFLGRCKVKATANDADIPPMKNGKVSIISDICNKIDKSENVECREN